MDHLPSPDREDLDILSVETPILVEWRRDNLREKIALLLTCAVIALAFFLPAMIVAFPDRAAAISQVGLPVAASLMSTFAAIIGFYFGRSGGH